MTALRWKRRRHGWAGFDGTSRKAVARVERKPRTARLGVCQAYYRFRSWLRAPSIGEAIRWCEQRHRAEHAPPPRETFPALFVHADGATELRALDSLRPCYIIAERPPMDRVWIAETDEHPASLPIVETIYEGRPWAHTYEFPAYGIHGDVRIMIYAHPEAPLRVVELAARRYLREQIYLRDPRVRRNLG